jgi:hypothetical protein
MNTLQFAMGEPFALSVTFPLIEFDDWENENPLARMKHNITIKRLSFLFRIFSIILFKYKSLLTNLY